MEHNLSEKQAVLLKRLSQIAARTQQSKKRHYDAASAYRKRQLVFSVLLIIFSALTVGLISILSAKDSLNIFSSVLLSYMSLVSIVSSAITMGLSIYLMTFKFETASIIHEQSAHRYTSIRDKTIEMAYRVRYSWVDDKGIDDEVYEIERECDQVNASAPPIPKTIDIRARSQERRSSNPRYWFRNFTQTEKFIEEWLAELKSE